jgi:fucose permease
MFFAVPPRLCVKSHAGFAKRQLELNNKTFTPISIPKELDCMTNITATFQRNRFTWLAYLLLAFYGYFINILGPIAPFLKEELHLSYTISSLHYTAFAVGMLLVGLGGHVVIERIGRARALWLGAFGISAGAVLLVTGRTAVLTIGASFCMGLVGSLILAIIPSALSDQHGEARAVALSEANVIASLVSIAAPLMVGWFAHLLSGGWRLALGAAALVPFLLLMGFRNVTPPSPASHADDSASQKPLPVLFWVYWVAVFLAVAAEFCMISWSADYLGKHLGMSIVDAAQSVSLFMIGMIVGRWSVSRLVQSFSVRNVVLGSILVAGIGFTAFWTTGSILFGLAGLFLTGLGVAGLYPLLLSLAMEAAQHNTVRGSALATLASGMAVLALPLLLGRLADMAGIWLAYGVEGIILVSVFLIVLFAKRGEVSS